MGWTLQKSDKFYGYELICNTCDEVIFTFLDEYITGYRSDNDFGERIVRYASEHEKSCRRGCQIYFQEGVRAIKVKGKDRVTGEKGKENGT